MKITLEQEVGGRERTCVAVYNKKGELLSSCWVESPDNPLSVMDMTKGLLEPILIRYIGIEAEGEGD